MNHVCVIAEAGVNHNGDFKTALKMIDAAKEANADYIKFQTFIPEKLVSKYAEKADYQKQTTDASETQLQMLKGLTLTNSNFIELKEYCDKIGIGFLSTPFDLDSICFLDSFQMDFWKIPSGEVTNLPYLEAIAKTKRKVIMSTGLCDLKDIQSAVSVLRENGTPEVILLHCNTQYPTPYEHVNLRAMQTLKNVFKTEVGYSDHTRGIEVPIAAVAMGATVIEKHFTLNKQMEGPDHKASLDPKELKVMVESIRNIEKSLGSGVKSPTPSEISNISVARKSIVASRNIEKGEVLTEENLTTKRPGNGISPMEWYHVLGRIAKKNFKEDEMIEI